MANRSDSAAPAVLPENCSQSSETVPMGKLARRAGNPSRAILDLADLRSALLGWRLVSISWRKTLIKTTRPSAGWRKYMRNALMEYLPQSRTCRAKWREVERLSERGGLVERTGDNAETV